MTQICLLLEKFTLTQDDGDAADAVSSNRLVLPESITGASSIVIRAEYIHVCIRLAAALIEYAERNPFSILQGSFKFAEGISACISQYDMTAVESGLGGVNG